MENLILSVLLYVLLIAIIYQPKPDTEKIDYFPEVVEPVAKVLPKVVVEPLPKPAFKPPTPTPAAKADLSSLTIRQLYSLAAERKVPRYKALDKKTLIQRLS